MTVHQLTACRSCGHPILFAVNIDTGRRIPLDPEPADDGTVRLDPASNNAKVLKRDQATNARDIGIPLHRAHFATCPHADQWRAHER
jgi:hypothetical protein